MRVSLVVSLVVMWVSLASAAMPTIVCPGGAGCVGNDYLVISDVENVKVYVDGSVIVDGAALRDARVICRTTAPRDGVVMRNGGSLQNVTVEGDCGGGGFAGVGIRDTIATLYNVTARGSIDGHGVAVVNSVADVFGLYTNSPKLDGLHVEHSAVRIAAFLVRVSATPGSVGLFVDEFSSGLVARSRCRHNGNTCAADVLLSLTANVCDPVGLMQCAPGHQGVQPDHAWTVCEQNAGGSSPSYQNGYCDFTTIDAALSAASDGDVIVVDTPLSGAPWPGVVVNKSVALVSSTNGSNIGGKLESGAMQGTYQYNNPLASLTVAAPGVSVTGFHVVGAVIVQPDTIFVDVD